MNDPAYDTPPVTTCARSARLLGHQVLGQGWGEAHVFLRLDELVDGVRYQGMSRARSVRASGYDMPL